MTPPILGDAAPAGRPTYTFVRNLGGHGPATWRLCVMHHEGFDRDVAQKTVLMTPGAPAAVAFAEPRRLLELDGDFIVPILDAQFDPAPPDSITLVTPFYPDGSIHDSLQAGYRFSLSQAATIGSDLLNGASRVHRELNCVHGDIKGGQVLLHHARSRGLLGDLGSAAPIDATGTAPIIMPTFLFLAPEAYLANRLTTAADVYSAGLTIFELINGPLDYPTLIPNAMARLAAGRRGVPDSALIWQPYVPDSIRAVVQKAISTDQLRRYRDPLSMARALLREPVIDWRQTNSGPGLEGEWEGTWPPRRALPLRRRYRVRVYRTRRGLFADAMQQTSASAGWRRFGVPDQGLAAAPEPQLRRFFSAVQHLVAQNLPNR
jgi:serine/threonine protein kinase